MVEHTGQHRERRSGVICSIDGLRALLNVHPQRLLAQVSPQLLHPAIQSCEVLKDQGDDILKTPEDSLAVSGGARNLPSRFVVADGVSGAYVTPPGPGLVGGVSSGRAVSQALVGEVFWNRNIRDCGLEQLVQRANNRAGQLNKMMEPPYILSDLSTWAGTTGALFEVKGPMCSWIVWGDARLLIERKDGTTFLTKDGLEAHEHDVEPQLQRMIRQRMDQGMEQAEARREAWSEYMPIFRQTRRERINDNGELGFSLLNGRPEFLLSRYLSKGVADVRNLRRAILFTDGCILRSECNESTTPQRIIGLVRQGGLASLIEDTRQKERLGATTHSHVTHAEGVAISLLFR